MYRDGQGVPQNYETAFKWYRLAAEQEYDRSQFNFGVMFGKVNGIPQDGTIEFN